METNINPSQSTNTWHVSSGNLVVLADKAIVVDKVIQPVTNGCAVQVTYHDRAGNYRITEVPLQDPNLLIISTPDRQTLKACHRQEHQVRAINKRLQQVRGREFLGIHSGFYKEMCAIPALTLNGKQSAEQLLNQLETTESKLSEGHQWLTNKAEEYSAALNTLKEPAVKYTDLIIPGINKNYARKVEEGGFYATYRYNRASTYFQVTRITDGRVSIKLSDGREGYLTQTYYAIITEDARYPIDSVVPVPISSFNQIKQYIDGMKAQEQYRVKVAKLYRATLDGKTPQVFDYRVLTCIPVGYGYTPHKMRVAVAQHIGETIYSMDAILYELEEAIKLTRQFIAKYAIYRQ